MQQLEMQTHKHKYNAETHTHTHTRRLTHIDALASQLFSCCCSYSCILLCALAFLCRCNYCCCCCCTACVVFVCFLLLLHFHFIRRLFCTMLTTFSHVIITRILLYILFPPFPSGFCESVSFARPQIA